MGLSDKKLATRRHKAELILIGKHGELAHQVVDRLTDNQLVELSNQWPERAAAVMREVASGKSFSAALINSKNVGVYDTNGWHERISRLGRGRGCLLSVNAVLLHQGCGPSMGRSAQEKLQEDATAIARSTIRLAACLKEVKPGMELPARGNTEMFDATKKLTAPKLLGRIKLCQSFLAKSVRDAPLILRKTGQLPTSDQAARVLIELGRLWRGAVILDDMVTRQLHGRVTQPQYRGDIFGVGQRYAAWLDPLANVLNRATCANSEAETFAHSCSQERHQLLATLRRYAEGDAMLDNAIAVWRLSLEASGE
jgi:hypothetical protein